MKNLRLKMVALILGHFLFATDAYADEQGFDYFVDLGMSSKQMSLSISESEFDAEFMTLDLAFTVAYDKFFASLAYEPSIKDDVRSDGSGLIFYSREDTTLTAGMNVWPGVSLFGGYRQGTTSGYYSVSNDESLVESNGVFAGISYNRSFDDKGSAVVSLAIAQLSGNVSLKEPFVNRGTIPGTPPDQIDGDALGFSLGLRWVGQLSDVSTYNVGLKIHRYEFEDSTNFGGLDLSFNEDFTSLSAGITHYF
ncbi:MAG: hypothetical protein PVJ39_09460 [Gammaproteobacteria bacterium]|jgi:hypothetical protein